MSNKKTSPDLCAFGEGEIQNERTLKTSKLSTDSLNQLHLISKGKQNIMKNNLEVKKSDKVVDKSRELYYFYSVGCGWCKRTEPIVDELNKDGYNILKLDLADSENQKIQNELKSEYKKQCGTPWIIDPETGNDICGFREKDILQKLAEGEEIPAPPRPTGPMPRPPFHGVSEEEENKWKEEYSKWSEENSHLPNLQTAEQILERPRPKFDPPQPPKPNSTDEEYDKWVKEYDKWKSANEHLPNLQPGNVIVERFKQRANGPASAAPPSAGGISPNLEARFQRSEQKVDKLIQHLGAK